ncbi:hypothetical protein NDU88_004801 [Pleurodeles waltl]|uniref:Uncharacterized protein n=1 Tax=Pleurodeles waltl TaxID=8319 RepID=A0AAV7RM09_PLEWA|nr:hypothetical protein NDU88_004801 [Pleurodeles waltl]
MPEIIPPEGTAILAAPPNGLSSNRGSQHSPPLSKASGACCAPLWCARVRFAASAHIKRPPPAITAHRSLRRLYKTRRARSSSTPRLPSPCLKGRVHDSPLPAAATRCLSDAPDLRGKRAPLPHTTETTGVDNILADCLSRMGDVENEESDEGDRFGGEDLEEEVNVCFISEGIISEKVWR